MQQPVQMMSSRPPPGMPMMGNTAYPMTPQQMLQAQQQLQSQQQMLRRSMVAMPPGAALPMAPPSTGCEAIFACCCPSQPGQAGCCQTAVPGMAVDPYICTPAPNGQSMLNPMSMMCDCGVFATIFFTLMSVIGFIVILTTRGDDKLFDVYGVSNSATFDIAARNDIPYMKSLLNYSYQRTYYLVNLIPCTPVNNTYRLLGLLGDQVEVERESYGERTLLNPLPPPMEGDKLRNDVEAKEHGKTGGDNVVENDSFFGERKKEEAFYPAQFTGTNQANTTTTNKNTATTNPGNTTNAPTPTPTRHCVDVDPKKLPLDPFLIQQCQASTSLTSGWGYVCNHQLLTGASLYLLIARWNLFRDTLYFIAMGGSLVTLVLIYVVYRAKLQTAIASNALAAYALQNEPVKFLGTNLYYVFRCAWFFVSLVVFFIVCDVLYEYWRLKSVIMSQVRGPLYTFFDKYDDKFIGTLIPVVIYVCWPLFNVFLEIALWFVFVLPWLMYRSMCKPGVDSLRYPPEVPLDDLPGCVRLDMFFTEFNQVKRLGFSAGLWYLLTDSYTPYLDCCGSTAPVTALLPGFDGGSNKGALATNLPTPPMPGTVPISQFGMSHSGALPLGGEAGLSGVPSDGNTSVEKSKHRHGSHGRRRSSRSKSIDETSFSANNGEGDQEMDTAKSGTEGGGKDGTNSHSHRRHSHHHHHSSSSTGGDGGSKHRSRGRHGSSSRHKHSKEGHEEGSGQIRLSLTALNQTNDYDVNAALSGLDENNNNPTDPSSNKKGKSKESKKHGDKSKSRDRGESKSKEKHKHRHTSSSK